MEVSGPAVLDRPSPGLSLAPVQQLKRKQGKLHKETSSCSLAALTGGWGDSWAISNFLCVPMLCLVCVTCTCGFVYFFHVCCPLSEGLYIFSSCMYVITAKDIASEGEMVENFPLHQLSP